MVEACSSSSRETLAALFGQGSGLHRLLTSPAPQAERKEEPVRNETTPKALQD